MTTLERSFAGKLAFAGLCLMAAGLAFSISVAQIGLGIALVIFLFALATKAGRASINLQGIGRLKIFYLACILWVFWRLYHVIISPEPLKELIEVREVWLMLIPLFVYLYASDRRRLWTVITIFIAGAAVSAFFGAWKQRAELFNVWERGRGLSNFHHLNFGGVCSFAAILGLGLTWAYYFNGRKLRAAFSLFLTLGAILGLWLSKSKGIIAPFLAVLPLFVYLQLYNRVQRMLFLLILFVAGIVLFPRIPNALIEQFRIPPQEVHVGSQAERRDLWQAGLAMVKDRPVVGWGERGYNLAYGRFQVPGAYGVAVYDAKDQSASHMHNDFLNTWVLYGAVGLILQLLYYFLGVGFYIAGRFRLSRESDRPLAAAGAVAGIHMAFIGLTQCHFTAEIVQMSFWLTCGVLYTVLESDRAGFSMSDLS